MSEKIRKSYMLEFKLEAVWLVKAGQTNGRVAKGLGLAEQTVGNWVKADDAKRLSDGHLAGRHRRCRKGIGRIRQRGPDLAEA